MLRKLGLLLLPMLLVVAACGGDSRNAADSTSTREATSTASAPQPTATDEAPEATATPLVLATPDLSGAGSVLSAVNPLQMVNSFSAGVPSQQPVRPELASGLLVPSDLPSAFSSLGQFGFTIPSELGPLEMAANMFSTMDVATGDFGTMVMSAVIDMPPEAADEVRSMPSLTDADLQELSSLTSDFGVQFSDLHVLDSSGLGEGGAGMHMVMNFGDMIDAFGGSPDGPNPFEAGIAIDMYMFVQDSHMYMTMVMWPAGDGSLVNARHLADTLDARAG